MGRIRILSDTVANKIAAGEVVERPASVVKELLENSLDAGAARLRIEIDRGGARLIRIADDGCGMMRDDAMLAFERHATSKLSDLKDLMAIATLGFRGEALPSIASVSRLLLETRSREETTGARVEIAGGKMLRCDEAALAPGTTTTVQDLFFNVPARKKFLRSEQTETAHIASLVTHYSLVHHDKDFQLLAGTRDLLQVTAVPSVRERVYQVFGSSVLNHLVEIESAERILEVNLPKPPPWAAPSTLAAEPDEPLRKTFRLRGFVSRPQLQKLNRNSIFLFVNRRLIRDRLLLHALSSAYHNIIPPNAYPFALLFLECDFDEVDVNVHPSKTEVRFRHQSFVHDFVRDSVREMLMRARPVSTLPLPASQWKAPRVAEPPPTARAPVVQAAQERLSPQPGAELPYSEFSQQIVDQIPEMLVAEFPPTAPPLPVSAAAAGQEPEFRLRPTSAPLPRLDFGDRPLSIDTRPAQEVAARPKVRLPIPDTHRAMPESGFEEAQSLDALRDLRPIGQLHDSFIIAAGRDGLWIIDQHVAHERILFEKVVRQQAAGRIEIQQLLVPLLIELTPAQWVEYDRISAELRAAGFETEPFGPRTIAVQAAPSGILTSDIEKLLLEILEIAESELRRTSIEELRAALAASIACHAAIKVNMRLDTARMEWLLKELANTEYPMSCPHGRPIALRYSTREILKGFHRI